MTESEFKSRFNRMPCSCPGSASTSKRETSISFLNIAGRRPSWKGTKTAGKRLERKVQLGHEKEEKHPQDWKETGYPAPVTMLGGGYIRHKILCLNENKISIKGEDHGSKFWKSF